MNGISVGLAMLLIKGIPECLIVAWAVHVFTNTPVDWKKYLIMAGIYVVSTYLIRFLPITLGINTVLCLFVLILSFQVIYKTGLSMAIRSIIASVIVLILIAFSEALNVILLTVVYGRENAETLFRFSDDVTRALISIPSNVFFALMVFAGTFIMKSIRARKAILVADAPQETPAGTPTLYQPSLLQERLGEYEDANAASIRQGKVNDGKVDSREGE